MIGLRIDGEKQLLRQLKRMGDAAGDSAQREALTSASAPIITDAQGRTDSENIREGIRLIQIVREGGEYRAEIGLPGGRQKWFYGLWVERGTGPRQQKKTGRLTGSMPARPFLRPAFDTQASRARDLYFATLRASIERAARG
jgi:hypothetical protein